MTFTMTTMETRIIEYHNYKTLFGPCLISFSIPILIPGLTLTFIGIYGNDDNFPTLGGWHIAGIVILSFAVLLLIIGIILRCVFRPTITPDIEAHLTPANSFYGHDNPAFASKERMIETMNGIYKGSLSDKHKQMRGSSPRLGGRKDSSLTRGESRDSKLAAAFVHGSPARRSSRDSSDNPHSRHMNQTKTQEEDLYEDSNTVEHSEDFRERHNSNLDHYQDHHDEYAHFTAGGDTKERNRKQSSETISKTKESVIVTIDKNGRPIVQKRDTESPSVSKHSDAMFKEMENSLHNHQGQRRKKRSSCEEDEDIEDSVIQAAENESANTEKHEGRRQRHKSRRQSTEEYRENEDFAQDAPEKYEERRKRHNYKSRRQSKEEYPEKEVFAQDDPGEEKNDPDSSSPKGKSLYSEGIRQTKHKKNRKSSTMSSDALILGSTHVTTTIEGTATVHTETITEGDTRVHSADVRTDGQIDASVRKKGKKKKKRKSVYLRDQEITELETVPNSNIHSYESTEPFSSPVTDTGKEESVHESRKHRLKKELSTSNVSQGSNISQNSILAQYMTPK